MQNNFEGMTVNERLFTARLSNDFDLAVRKKDRNKLVDILKTVALSEKEANLTIDAIFSDPKKYGY